MLRVCRRSGGRSPVGTRVVCAGAPPRTGLSLGNNSGASKRREGGFGVAVSERAEWGRLHDLRRQTKLRVLAAHLRDEQVATGYAGATRADQPARDDQQRRRCSGTRARARLGESSRKWTF